jgi:hypothetical protein
MLLISGLFLPSYTDTRLHDTDPDKTDTVEFYAEASDIDGEVTVYFVHYFTPKKAKNGNFDPITPPELSRKQSRL